MVKFIMNQQQCECVDIEEERQGMKILKLQRNKACVQSSGSEYNIQIFLLSNKFNKSHYAEASINPKGPGWCSKYIVIAEISRDVMNNGTLSWFVMDKIFEVKLDYFYISQLDIGGFL